MHLYVVAKGIKPHLELWQNDLLAQYLPVMKNGEPYIDEDGNQSIVQLSVRPVQLFEIGFPKEHLEHVMNLVGTSDYVLDRYPKLKFIANSVRKFLRLKEAPKPTTPIPRFQPHVIHKAVAVIPVGTKEDDMNEDGTEKL